MPNVNEIDVGYDAGRLCDAISKIGYEPHTAIMDIVDNSVTANATEIKISLELVAGKNLKSRNSVFRYQIIDNGDGMDENGIKNALKPGSDSSSYKPKSLSKYGMGLKSAGLSLGSAINIISKKEGKFGLRYTFDKHTISQKRSFVITKHDLTSDDLSRYTELLPGSQGTIVEIEGCQEINHASPNSTVEKLRKRLGVVYFSFLSRKNPLQLSTRVIVNGQLEPFESIIAKDMLFMDHPEFKKNWDPDAYDYSSPYLVLEENWNLSDKDDVALSPVKIYAVAFPQNAMGERKSPLEVNRKEIVQSYEVSRENMGFYVYRNGRLIRWGDDLEGLVGKDDINIRFRIDLETEHDDVLHVDVTKQRLEIDDEIRGRLKLIISKAKETAAHIRDACQKYLNEPSGVEGKSFSETTKNVPEDDPQELGAGAAPEETQTRRKQRSVEAKAILEKLNKEAEDNAQQDQTPQFDVKHEEFRKVRYSEKIAYGQVWKPFYDAKYGVFVCINKHHPFYQEFLSRFPDNSAERIVIEALIFSVAVAESNVVDNVRDINREVLESIFKRFHKNVDGWLNNWTEENINLATK